MVLLGGGGLELEWAIPFSHHSLLTHYNSEFTRGGEGGGINWILLINLWAFRSHRPTLWQVASWLSSHRITSHPLPSPIDDDDSSSLSFLLPPHPPTAFGPFSFTIRRPRR